MKRGHIKTEAIVLRASDYSESDRILTLLTREYGKLSAIAKGAKRSKRRFVGRLDVITLVDAMLFKNSSTELARLDDVTLIDAHTGLKTHMEKLGYASYMTELVDEFVPPGEPCRAVFEHLKGFLKMLEERESADSLTRFFEIRLLYLSGVMPYLEGCVICKRETTGRMGFATEKGGLVCRECAVEGLKITELSAGTARTLLMATRLPMEKLHVLTTGEVFKKEARKMLTECIKYHLGKTPRCARFIEMMDAI